MQSSSTVLPAPDIETLLNDLADYFETAIAEDRDDFIDIVEGASHFRTVLETICTRVGAHGAALVFLDPSLTFETIFGAGSAKTTLVEWWSRVGTNKGLVGRAVALRRTIWTPDVSIDEYYEKVSEEPTVSQLTLLLTDHGTPQAAISLEWSEAVDEGNVFVREREEFARRLGMLFFSFRARVFALRSRLAVAAAQRIAALDRTEDLVGELFQAVQKLTRGGEVALLDRIGSQLHVLDKDKLTPVPPPIDILVEERNGYVAEVAFTRKPFYCDNTEDAKRFPYYRKVDDSTRTQFSIPLIFRRELVGVLNVGSPYAYAFNHMTRDLLIQFASHAATILYNAIVTEGIRRSYKHVRSYLGYLQIIAPSVVSEAATDGRPRFAERVEHIRTIVEDVWAGLSPPPEMQTHSSRDAGTAIATAVTEALRNVCGNAVNLETTTHDADWQSVTYAPSATRAACEAAVRAVARTIASDPHSLSAKLTVRQCAYDRQASHPRLNAGTDPTHAAYLVVELDWSVSAAHLAAIPLGQLVDPSLASPTNALAPVPDLGITLWSCDRTFAMAGGFVGAVKLADDRLRLAFWLPEGNTVG